MIILSVMKQKNPNSFLLLKLPQENCSDPENVIQSKCYDIAELQQLKTPNKENSLSLFHINSYSLNKSFEELQILLKSKNITFDVIAITETGISENVSVTLNIILNNYSFEHPFVVTWKLIKNWS